MTTVDIEQFGRPFRLDDLDSLNLRSGGGFEAGELAFVQRRVRPGSVCLDIGANIGLFTVALARAAGPEGRVHAFEPDPDNFAILQHNVSHWRDRCDIRLHRMACGAGGGRALLHRSTENRGMHRLYDSACCQGDAVEVVTAAVDEVVHGPVDFIKIDIEGYEPVALRGLVATISRSPDVTLLTEFSPMSMLEAGSTASGYLDQLRGLGLAARRLVSGEPTPVDPGQLADACRRLERGDFAAFRARCMGQNAVRIFEAASAYAAELGYDQPLIENLVFTRAGP